MLQNSPKKMQPISFVFIFRLKGITFWKRNETELKLWEYFKMRRKSRSRSCLVRSRSRYRNRKYISLLLLRRRPLGGSPYPSSSRALANCDLRPQCALKFLPRVFLLPAAPDRWCEQGIPKGWARSLSGPRHILPTKSTEQKSLCNVGKRLRKFLSNVVIIYPSRLSLKSLAADLVSPARKTPTRHEKDNDSNGRFRKEFNF